MDRLGSHIKSCQVDDTFIKQVILEHTGLGTPTQQSVLTIVPAEGQEAELGVRLRQAISQVNSTPDNFPLSKNELAGMSRSVSNFRGHEIPKNIEAYTGEHSIELKDGAFVLGPFPREHCGNIVRKLVRTLAITRQDESPPTLGIDAFLMVGHTLDLELSVRQKRSDFRDGGAGTMEFAL